MDFYLFCRQLCIVEGEKSKVEKFSSVGLDGAMVLWTFKVRLLLYMSKPVLVVCLVYDLDFGYLSKIYLFNFKGAGSTISSVSVNCWLFNYMHLIRSLMLSPQH